MVIPSPDKTTGDLLQMALDGHFDVIAHGCNCQNKMEKGFALALRKVFPQAWEADQATPKGARSKLGGLSRAWVDVRGGKKLLVVNLYTQFFWGAPGEVDETVEQRQEAIASSSLVLAKLLKDNRNKAPWAPRKPRIGIPTIGAGLAGGDWETNKALITSALRGVGDVIVVHYPERTKTGPSLPSPVKTPSAERGSTRYNL